MIVVDASVLVTALADDEADGDTARGRLSGEVLVAPHVIDLEVLSAWRSMAAAGELDDERVEIARSDLADLAMLRVPHAPLLARCWELRHSLSVYDAAYVALAETLDVQLLTADERLSRSPGIRCPVDVMS